ncbi:YqgE/AlgH family protein [Penaeicola halotolerans]|uniref:YqgE/AlgH family protein n=1 Tax=Penaeicola halotolerans TaxID=2793196 RepID=UPI001CF887B7|nr:YqgE/AlgH family protein [Penaeicola halotolerans]
MTVKAGDLLISEPYLKDDSFFRSVILVCESNSNGSFGLVLNKLSIVHLSDLIDQVSITDTSDEVYVGGPVEQNTLHYIYKGIKPISGSVHVAGDIYWGGDFDELLDRLKEDTALVDSFRFFMGYSGWEAGQLEKEIEEDTWVLFEQADLSMIWETQSEELWKQCLKDMGGKYKALANYPIDPRLN